MSVAPDSHTDDPFLWLEEIDGAAALDWVSKQNAITTGILASRPEFEAINARLLKIYNSPERIPMVSARGGHWYNFWQDAAHPRGLWRRTTPEEYRRVEPNWEELLDLDALCLAEGENWVFNGAQCLFPDYQRALISLSRGGGDACVVREFDLGTRSFVPGGFMLAEGKSMVEWIDVDALYVATDFGAGTMSAAGYPLQLKVWRRGTPLEDAELVFAAEDTDTGVRVRRVHDWVEGELVWRDLIYRWITFFTGCHYLRTPEGLVRLPLPEDAELDTFQDQILVRLRSDWTLRPDDEPAGGLQAGAPDPTHKPAGAALPDAITFPQGALLAIGLEAFLRGSREWTLLYTPGPRKSLDSFATLRDGIVLNERIEMRSCATLWRRVAGRWFSSEMELPAAVTSTLSAVDADRGDECFMLETSPIKPSTLSLVESTPRAATRLRSAPAHFDAAGVEVVLHHARSRDGTRIPYTLVTPRGFQANGKAPTLLYAYGGFEISLLPPGYNATVGAAWLEQGGVYAIAGIRGGGEFGPAWHQAAQLENKQRSYDDLIAVSEDLVERGITSAAHLAIEGGSNGGLLVGAVMAQRPELYKAVVCRVPLLDMLRYHRLLAGASWMGEFGNPEDPVERQFILRYSPYQNVRADVRYPHLLLLTSTRDDRVHPGHARKMAARMQALGHRVLYYENIEGGHAGSADHTQAARMSAFAYTFLLGELR